MITGVHDGLWRGAGDVLPVHPLSWMDDFGFLGWLANSSLSYVTDMSAAEQSKAQNERLSSRQRTPCRIFSCQIRWTITRYSSLFWSKILDWGSFSSWPIVIFFLHFHHLLQETIQESNGFVLQAEERKQAAADALTHYSQFAMACIGQGVTPSHLRLHLLKVINVHFL
jgi:hypothetical protein